jgi:hypothetical protein
MAITINGTDGNPLTTRDVDGSANDFIYVQGRFAFSGNYSTGGDTLDWTTVNDKLSSASCVSVFVDWQAIGNGYFPIGGPATALNAWKLKVQTPGTFNSELAAGAYPGAVTGDTVAFQATFRKLLNS